MRIPTDAVGYAALAFLVVGFSELSIPFEGGTLVPYPNFVLQTVVDSATSCLGTGFGSLMLLNRSGDGLIEKVVNGYLRDPLAVAAAGWWRWLWLAGGCG